MQPFRGLLNLIYHLFEEATLLLQTFSTLLSTLRQLYTVVGHLGTVVGHLNLQLIWNTAALTYFESNQYILKAVNHLHWLATTVGHYRIGTKFGQVANHCVHASFSTQ